MTDFYQEGVSEDAIWPKSPSFRGTKSRVARLARKNASLKAGKAQERLPNPPAVTFRGTSGTLVPLREHPTTPGEPMCSCVSRLSHTRTHMHVHAPSNTATPREGRRPLGGLCPLVKPHALQAPLTLLQGQALHEGTAGHSPVGRQSQPRRLEAVFFSRVQSSFLLPCNQTASQNDTVGGKKKRKKKPHRATTTLSSRATMTRTKHQMLCQSAFQGRRPYCCRTHIPSVMGCTAPRLGQRSERKHNQRVSSSVDAPKLVTAISKSPRALP